MRTSLGSQPRRRPSRAFTLVELLVVLTIMLILAGMVLSAAGYVQKKAGRTRAEGELAALAAAIEAYKSDNGNYPRAPDGNGNNSSVTDKLDPASGTPQVRDPSSQEYQDASQFLYGQLSGDYDNSNPTAKTNYDYAINGNETTNRVYFNFPPSMLYVATTTPGKLPTSAPDSPAASPPPKNDTYLVYFIRDPFGYPYGYSTAGQKTPTPGGYNPTYDLWSTAGTACHDCSGNPNQKCCAVAQSNGQDQWIKNW